MYVCIYVCIYMTGAAAAPVPLPKHVFETDVGDHCETPLAAYRDINPVFDAICQVLNKPKKRLKLYDP